MAKPSSGTSVNPSSPYAAGLAAAFALNEGSGTTVNDSSGMGNTLTLSATAPTWTTTGGEAGLAFAGTGDVASSATTPTSSSLYLNGSSYTLVTRVYDAGTPQPNGAVFGKVVNDFHYQLAINSGNQQIQSQLKLTGGTIVVSGPGSSVGGGLNSMHGQMNTVACRGDGTNISIWLNGTKLNEISNSGSLVPNTDGFAIGARGRDASSEYNDFVSAVWVWNRALTDTELANLHTDPWSMYAAGGSTAGNLLLGNNLSGGLLSMAGGIQ